MTERGEFKLFRSFFAESTAEASVGTLAACFDDRVRLLRNYVSEWAMLTEHGGARQPHHLQKFAPSAAFVKFRKQGVHEEAKASRKVQ